MKYIYPKNKTIAIYQKFYIAMFIICIGGQTVYAQSEKIQNPIAVFAGLDKITAEITTFEVTINDTYQFGTLRITPRVCYSRPITEKPIISSFVQIEDQNAQQKQNLKQSKIPEKYIFSGWMFAQSPALNALEHPVYDVWLIKCKTDERSSSEQNL